MKKLYLLPFLILLLNSCTEEKPAQDVEVVSQDSTFNNFKENFILHFWEIYPEYASAVGYHNYDSIMTIPDEAYFMKQLAFAEQYLDSLDGYVLEQLGPHNKTDYYLIRNQLESIQWYINKFNQYEWDPSYYNVGGSISEILNGRYAPLDERMDAIARKIEYVPAYYAQAKLNIKNPTLEHTQLGIAQNQGTLNVLKDAALADSVSVSGINADRKANFRIRRDSAVAAVQDYIKYLEGMLPQLQDSAHSFRIGKDLYEQKFQYDLIASYSVDEIFENAQKEKRKTQQEMLQLTKKLWPKYFNTTKDSVTLADVKVLIERVSQKHVKRDDFMGAIERQLPELEKFVREKDLLFLDPEKPLEVRETPEFMRGIAGASISSPGPYDKFEPTYYNVTPLDEMTEEQAESYLREYNYWMLQILNIHEAIPGHYAQLVYANESPSIVKSILGNTTMIEGWACYAERMMLEAGYGNNEDELWLMYYKWYLRIITNTILDISVHTRNMSKEQAMELLMNEAFQERTEAEGKWRRVTLTSVQLCSYFTGLTEILALREDMRERQGEQFNLKQFHETFLSFGSAPVKYIREMMIGEVKSNK